MEHASAFGMFVNWRQMQHGHKTAIWRFCNFNSGTSDLLGLIMRSSSVQLVLCFQQFHPFSS